MDMYYFRYYNSSVEQVPMRELNQDTAGVLARVENGETVEITSRGRAIARIVPLIADPLMDLVNARIVIPATIPGPIPMPTQAAAGGTDAGQLISTMRDEERW
jgi:prevent-host-death family protein